MKKLIALILVLLLCSSAMAATVDWSSMTDDEIVELLVESLYLPLLAFDLYRVGYYPHPYEDITLFHALILRNTGGKIFALQLDRVNANVQKNVRAVIRQHGSLHCCTMQYYPCPLS